VTSNKQAILFCSVIQPSSDGRRLTNIRLSLSSCRFCCLITSPIKIHDLALTFTCHIMMVYAFKISPFEQSMWLSYNVATEGGYRFKVTSFSLSLLRSPVPNFHACVSLIHSIALWDVSVQMLGYVHRPFFNIQKNNSTPYIRYLWHLNICTTVSRQ